MIDADKLGKSKDYWETAWGIPIVDAEQVVRCKDCKFNYANQIPSDDVCQLCVELPITKEFYCAYGEKGLAELLVGLVKNERKPK